ncbi:MAG TPA: PfkB family carbohydrate kinase [Bacteroidia bacterium]|jgi:bifunctional ADP-heptose synthase (sugar kinase/adenylyltransferase)|nr:PfkB family carbohydrate kinase [Bacteroidia bacterium]
MLTQTVEEFIRRAASLRVAVIGETIIDEFMEVVYEGHSIKSACPVYKLSGNDRQSQQGGAAAIAGHLKDFVKSVELITNTRNEIVKTRYVDSFDKKKHVEINKFDSLGFGALHIDTRAYDVCIVADFGHGFCNKLDINDGFHLNCQTNSNNFGFNRLSKWKKYRKKSVSLDLREASLQMNRNITDSNADIQELFNYEMNSESVFLTLGGKGSVYTNGKALLRQEAYPSSIVDTIGAGDTYFSFACLLAALGQPVADLAIPSLAASLSTTWLCNERSVTKQSLTEYANRFIP